MANVFLIGLERKAATEIASAASIGRHHVFDRPHSVAADELSHAGIVFAGGPPQVQLSFLRRVRRAYPTLPVVVVTETVDMGNWLDALEEGATDYCWSPVVRRHIQRLLESLVPMHRGELSIGYRGKAATHASAT